MEPLAWLVAGAGAEPESSELESSERELELELGRGLEQSRLVLFDVQLNLACVK